MIGSGVMALGCLFCIKFYAGFIFVLMIPGSTGKQLENTVKENDLRISNEIHLLPLISVVLWVNPRSYTSKYCQKSETDSVVQGDLHIETKSRTNPGT